VADSTSPPPLHEVLTNLDAWTASGEAVALATVVRTVGSSPRPVGARMAITDSERMVGSVSGGCVEGAVSETALDVLRTGLPQLLTFGVADEDAWAVGLSCGGTIEVYVEPLPSGPEAREFEAFRAALQEGRPVALATRIEGPSRVGARLLVESSGIGDASNGPGVPAAPATTPAAPPAWTGTLGDPTLDLRIARRARERLAEGRSEVIEDESGRIFLEAHSPAPRLVIVGAVHIAVTLARIARELGFRVVVTDARGRFATPDRFPDVDDLILGWPHEVLPALALDAFSHVVVITHDAKIDNPALLAALRSPAPYIGALGSRRTHARRVAALREAGATDTDISRIHSPIGLDIGARTPQEIALATMAEVVAVRNAATRSNG